jgi:hypothetical protein
MLLRRSSPLSSRLVSATDVVACGDNPTSFLSPDASLKSNLVPRHGCFYESSETRGVLVLTEPAECGCPSSIARPTNCHAQEFPRGTLGTIEMKHN